MIKKKKNVYYVALIKESNRIEVCTSKTEAARFVGVSYDTVKRHLEHVLFYDTVVYTIWKNVSLIKSNRVNNSKARI